MEELKWVIFLAMLTCSVCLSYGTKYKYNVVENTALQTEVGLQLVVSSWCYCATFMVLKTNISDHTQWNTMEFTWHVTDISHK